MSPFPQQDTQPQLPPTDPFEQSYQKHRAEIEGPAQGPDPRVGADPLKGILDPLKVDGSLKADAWDAWHGAKTPEDFQRSFDKLNLPNEVKASLWDLKFKPPASGLQEIAKIPGVKVTPQQAQTPAPQMGPMGWYGPTVDAIRRGLMAPGTMFGPGGLQPQQQMTAQQTADQASQQVPQALELMQQHPIRMMLGQLFGGSAMPLSEQGAIQGRPAFDVQQAMQPQSQFGQGVAQGLTQLTTPQSAAQLALLPQSKGFGAYYAGQMGAETAGNIQDAIGLIRAGRVDEAKRLFGEATVTALMTGAIGAHLASGRESAQPSPREALAETPGTIQRPGPTSQVAAQAAPSMAQEGGPQPVTQAGQTGAKDITGRTQGRQMPSTASAPIEGAGIGAGKGAPATGERRGLTPQPAYTGVDRRSTVDLAKEQMRATLPGQQTPGEQLSQQMRESTAGPRVADEMKGLALQRIMRDPQRYQQWKASDQREQGKMLASARDEILKEQQSAKPLAQRPTGVAQAPTPATAPAPQSVPKPLGAQEPLGAAREPLQSPQEPVRQSPAQPGQVASALEPKKPYTPLPASERPRVSAQTLKPDYKAPVFEKPAPIPVPEERKPAEIAPGVAATPRPEAASAGQVEAWKTTRRAEATTRDISLKAEAPYKPKIETRSPIGAALDRYLKPSENYKGDRGAELVRAVEDVKRQGPEAIKTASDELSTRAQRAETMSKWGTAQLDPSRLEFNAEAKAKLHAGTLRGEVDPETGKFVAEASGRWLTEKGVKGGRPAPSWQREASPDEAEALNRVRGNKLKEVGTARELSPEDAKQLQEWETNRDRLVEELRQRGQKVSERAMDQLKKYITGIQALKGTRFISEGGPEVRVGAEGGLEDAGTRVTRAMWNRFMGRPEGAHFKAPSPEEVQARIKELDKEAKWSRDLTKELGQVAPTVKEAPPPGATAPSAPEAPTKPADTLGLQGAGVMDHESLAKAAGLKYGGELYAGSGVHQFEDPSRPGQTMAVKAKDIPETGAVKYLRDRMRGKLEELKEAPTAETVMQKAPEPKADIPVKGGLKEPPGGRQLDFSPKFIKESTEVGRRLPEAPKAEVKPEPKPEVSKTAPTERGPVTKSSLTREGLEDIRTQIDKMPAGEDKASLENRHNDVTQRFEKLTEKMKWAMRDIEQLRKSGEKTRTHTDPKTGQSFTDSLQDLEMRVLKLGQERSKLINEEIPSLKTAAKALSAEPAPSALKGSQADELQSQRQHLANLINKGYGDTRAAQNLRKGIRKIESTLGFKAPSPLAGVKETLEGQSLLKAAKASEPKAPVEREKAVYAPEILKNTQAEELHELLTTGSLSTSLMDRLLTPQGGRKTPLLGEVERNSLAAPILKDFKSGDLTAGEASQRFNRALEVLVEGRRAASKLPDETRSAAMAKAFSNAIEIAKGRKLQLPSIKEGGFVGRPGGRGLEAGERIRREREAEEKGPFYNMSERVVREQWPGGSQAKASPKDIGGLLANAGVSKNELKWSDVDSYLLKAQKEGRQVSQKEVLDYLKEHNPKVEVTTKAQVKFNSAAEKQHDALRDERSRLYEAAKADARNSGLSDVAAGGLVESVQSHMEFGDEPDSSKFLEDYFEHTLKKPLPEAGRLAHIIDSVAKYHDVDRRFNEMSEMLNDAQSEHAPRYESYSLPGGSQYREVLLRIPVPEPKSTARLGPMEDLADPSHPEHAEWKDEEGGMHGMGRYRAETLDEPNRYIHGTTPEEVRAGTNRDAALKGSYQGPHFDEPNIVAHLRLKDRVDSQGRKTLFVEEVQSDWDRELREQERYDKLVPESTEPVNMRYEGGTPKMPFTQGHWLELAMKHVLKEAASKGYDSVAWTTGEQQANRYNLRHTVSEVSIAQVGEGRFDLGVRRVNDPNRVVNVGRSIPKEDFAQYIGKENAEKLIAKFEKSPELEGGVDTAVLGTKEFAMGGEHHLQLYDKMMPQFMEKYGKKWGAKVGQSEIMLNKADPNAKPSDYGDIRIKEVDSTAKIHSMDIPEGMRDVLKKPLRMIGGSQAGVFQLGARKAINNLFGKKAPQMQSTGPKFLERMRETSDAFKAARLLDEGIEERRFQQQGMRQRFMQGLSELPKVPELQRYMYKASERGEKFEGALKKAFDDHIRDWAELAEQRYHQLREAGHDVENYVPRVAIKKNTMWDRVLRGTGQYSMGSVLKQTANSLKGRRFFRMEAPGLPSDTIVHVDDSGNLTHWDKGTPVPLGLTRREMEASGASFKTALSDDISNHSGQEYLQHLYIATATNALSLDNAFRAHEFLEAYKNSPEFKRYATKAMPGDPIPDGYSHTKVPQLQGYAFEKHTTDVLDRYYNQLDSHNGNFLDKFNYGLMSTIYWNPLKHGRNVVDHWATHHGLSTFLNPTQYRPMAKAFQKAWRAVIDGNNDYLYALDNGMPLRGRTVSGEQMNEAILKQLNPMKMSKNAKTGETEFSPVAEKIARAWGHVDPRPLYKAYMNAQRKALFGLDDILRLQATYHHQQLTGDSFHQSWKEVSKHLPDYTLPTHVGLRVPFTNIDVPSSALAKAFNNKAVIFGRYHYGRLKSYGYMAQDIVSEDVPAKEKLKAIDRLFVPAVSMALYATLGTLAAQKLTGKPNAEMTPSGATSIPWTVMRLLQGKTSLGHAAMSTFTPNPLVDLAGRMGYGELSRPKPIGEQIKESSKGLFREVGPVREAEQTKTGKSGQVDFAEMARRAFLNVTVPKASSSGGHRGPHLPRLGHTR